MQTKLLNALGLSRRAGKCLAGEEAVVKAIRTEKAKLVAVDESASPATKKRMQTMCETRDILCIVVEGMGPAIGKPGGKVAAITDDNFKDMIVRALAQNT